MGVHDLHIALNSARIPTYYLVKYLPKIYFNLNGGRNNNEIHWSKTRYFYFPDGGIIKGNSPWVTKAVYI